MIKLNLQSPKKCLNPECSKSLAGKQKGAKYCSKGCGRGHRRQEYLMKHPEKIRTNRDSGGKICGRCETWRPRDEFSITAATRDGMGFRCKQCDADYHLVYDKKNKETRLARSQAHNSTPKAKARRKERDAIPGARDIRRGYKLKEMYGLTLEQFDSLLAAQGGVCALFDTCGASQPGGRGSWCIDHQHFLEEVWKEMPPEEKRKSIRGLLCTSCNTSRVGSNTVESARAVTQYLESFSTTK